MTDSPVALLRAHSRHAPWNARGLAAHATALVDSAGFRPTNTSARAAPSARAIRFYVAQRLLDRPEGAGTTATYGYRHLLQLLAIKIRQREGQTLEVIKKELAGVSGEQLERRVATALAQRRSDGAEKRCATDRRVAPRAGRRRYRASCAHRRAGRTGRNGRGHARGHARGAGSRRTAKLTC